MRGGPAVVRVGLLEGTAPRPALGLMRPCIQFVQIIGPQKFAPKSVNLRQEIAKIAHQKRQICAHFAKTKNGKVPCFFALISVPKYLIVLLLSSV